MKLQLWERCNFEKMRQLCDLMLRYKVPIVRNNNCEIRKDEKY